MKVVNKQRRTDNPSIAKTEDIPKVFIHSELKRIISVLYEDNNKLGLKNNKKQYAYIRCNPANHFANLLITTAFLGKTGLIISTAGINGAKTNNISDKKLCSILKTFQFVVIK